MRIRAALLDRMGTPAPYAETKPLRIADIELGPARPERSAGQDRGLPGFVIPTSQSSMGTGHAPCRWRLGTKRQAWWSDWEKTSPISPSATML
jgi:hypothetical protein